MGIWELAKVLMTSVRHRNWSRPGDKPQRAQTGRIITYLGQYVRTEISCIRYFGKALTTKAYQVPDTYVYFNTVLQIHPDQGHETRGKVRVRAQETPTRPVLPPPNSLFRLGWLNRCNHYLCRLTNPFSSIILVSDQSPPLTRSNGDLHCRDEAAISHIAIPYSLLVGFAGFRLPTKPIFIPTNQAATTCEARLLI